MMGLIDCDTHVMECASTWAYLDPGEEHYKPRNIGGAWVTEAVPVSTTPWSQEEYDKVFPPGSVDLSNAAARLKQMDALGVDVQVLFPSWWLNTDLHDPVAEAALKRTWNRWMADAISDSGGRLRWTVQVPLRMMDRAQEEMSFGREHGAVGVVLKGLDHGMGLGDPYYWPLYDMAQDLGLVIAVHVGGNRSVMSASPHRNFLNVVLPVVGAFVEMLGTGLPDRFPGLKWAFLEAGSSWLPYALQESLRSNAALSVRTNADWRSASEGLLASKQVYVACQIDDDVSYVVEFAGPDNLIIGTDYGHLDIGSDPDGFAQLLERSDVERGVLRRIADANGRALFGIDAAFCPTDSPVIRAS